MTKIYLQTFRKYEDDSSNPFFPHSNVRLLTPLGKSFVMEAKGLFVFLRKATGARATMWRILALYSGFMDMST
jgi:hypothetical protein